MRPSPLFPVTGLNNRFSGIASFNGFIAFLPEGGPAFNLAIEFSSSHPHQRRQAITSSLLRPGPSTSTKTSGIGFWHLILCCVGSISLWFEVLTTPLFIASLDFNINHRSLSQMLTYKYIHAELTKCISNFGNNLSQYKLASSVSRLLRPIPTKKQQLPC